MDSILALRKFVVPEFVFGVGARKLVARYAQTLRIRKIFLASDVGVQKSGWSGEIEVILRQAGFDVVPFYQISPNPRDHEVMTGSKEFLDTHCDGIVAIGGGSVIDAAKGIGVLASNGGSILDYEGVDRIPRPMPPLIAIPTTAGSSADVSQFAIINDTQRRLKLVVVSKSVVPDIALVDPETLLTMDPLLSACTGLDALTHAIEAFVSNASSPITDGHAMHALDLLWRYLQTSVANPQNLEALSQVMLASLAAGMAFSNASLGSVHAMAHSLGGLLDLPHGECNALLLPHVIAYNYEYAKERFDRIGMLWGMNLQGMSNSECCEALIAAVCDLRERVGIHWTLGSRGLNEDAIPQLAANAFRDPCNATNPRHPTENELASLFKEAL